MYLISSVILLLFVHDVIGQGTLAGEPCTTYVGELGRCADIHSCQDAIDDIKKGTNPKLCGFNGTDPVVCCASFNQTVVTTTPSFPSHTTAATPYRPDQSCEPDSPTVSAKKTGSKAWDKCLEYQEKYVYPCERSVVPGGGSVRAARCDHGGDDLIVRVDSTQRQYPHMVLLGLGSTPQTAGWLCGGALISERFILTAAHCSSHRSHGPVAFARLRPLRRSEPIDPATLYNIDRIIKHPGYQAPRMYHDIALLRTDIEMALQGAAVPACLPAGPAVDDQAAYTGWSRLLGPATDVMDKMTLHKLPTADCKTKFTAVWRLEQGFNDSTHICYGYKGSEDKCFDESGDPLQVKSGSVYCMHTVIGIALISRGCHSSRPVPAGLFTSIEPYTAWIENVVWP